MRGKVWIAAAVLLAAGTALGAGAGAQTQTAPSGEQQSARRPMTFEDMMKMRRLGDIDVSRDGKWVLFSATDVDLEKNTRTPHLWIVPVAGGQEKALTSSAVGESRGRFSPDGKQILFLTARSGGQQIWLADFNGEDGTIGEPQQITHISTDADGATWSPDGKHLLFQSAVYPECSANGQSGEDEDACDRKRDEEHRQSKVKAQIFTHLLYRHWNTFTDDKRTHLFLLSVDDGTFRDLNPGDTHDVPPFSLGEPDGWDFSPDGKEIAFEEKKVDDPALSTNVDIFTLRLDDLNAKPVKISTSPGGDFTPRYSPDGKYIAWRMQKRAGYESDRFRLVLYSRGEAASRSASQQVSKSAGGGGIREILPNFDRWVDEEVWSPDSKVIYFTAGDAGEEPIYSVGVDLGRLTVGSEPNRLTKIGEYGD
ncbi:MAG TPA: hypothetical protein VJS11_04735, partial [Acidobacteriaceae bacterium]|nr:hypothetical protein [Acidobacteriaceae bacterium]